MARVERFYDCEHCYYSYFDEFDRLRCVKSECCDGGKYDDSEEDDENERDR